MPPAINCPLSLRKSPIRDIELCLWSSIRDVDQEILDAMKNDGEIHLDPDYLEALNASKMRGFNQFIAAYKRNGKFIGYSVFQVVDMESDEPSGYLNIVPAWKLLFPKTHHTGRGIRARVLVGGDVFGTGVKLFRFQKNVSPEEQWELLKSSGDIIAQEEKESIDFWLIKDFVKGENPHRPASKLANLTAVNSEPLMILYCEKDWKSYSDYLAAMRTKYRTKAKAAFKRSKELKAQFLSLKEVKEHAGELLALYEQIWRQASFRPGKLNEEVLINWIKMMGDRCKVKVWRLNGEIVGFQFGFFSAEVLDAILVGFSFEKNREHSILERMLHEFVSWGIEAGVDEIRFGRTAGEMKSTIGCVPIQAFGMVKHGKAALNRVVKWVGPHLKPKAFPVRTPFKQKQNSR